MRKKVLVRIILENLLAVQQLELVPGKTSPERDRQILVLRGKIPERLLAHSARHRSPQRRSTLTFHG
jgi:hypothetical protein